MSAAEIAANHTMLRCEAGSRVLGISTESADKDELGICIEPPEYVVGLWAFEQWTHRTQPDGVRSGPGDLDVTVYCHHPESKILTAELEWLDAGSIVEGQKLVTFDAGEPSKNRHRHFSSGVVTGIQQREMERCRVITSKGETIVTPEHLFLARRSGTKPRTRWLRADCLKAEDEVYFLQPWTRDLSWGAGYLAGQFDGDGCLHFTRRSDHTGQHSTQTGASQLQWVQKAGRPDIAFVEGLLNERGFKSRKSRHRGNGCEAVYIANDWAAQMRFLGSVRPQRLLAHRDLARLWEARSLQVCTRAVVEDVCRLADGPMIAMETSTQTYLLDGFLTHNSLRKWARLALKGNPSVLLLLFVPPENCWVWSTQAAALQAKAHIFASRRAGNAFLGYMQQQRQRLTGERGQMNVNRPELVERHGFDTKYASHVIRLGFQGVEYLTTGRFSVPMPKEQAEYIRAIRGGDATLAEVLVRAVELEQKLQALIDGGSSLPDEPNFAYVNNWLVETYRSWWEQYV